MPLAVMGPVVPGPGKSHPSGCCGRYTRQSSRNASRAVRDNSVYRSLCPLPPATTTRIAAESMSAMWSAGGFTHTKPGAIDEREQGPVFTVRTLRENVSDLGAAKHVGQAFAVFGAGNLQGVQRSVEGHGKEESERRTVHVRGGGCDAALGQENGQKPPNILRGQRVDGAPAKPEKEAGVRQVTRPPVRRQPAPHQIPVHALEQGRTSAVYLHADPPMGPVSGTRWKSAKEQGPIRQRRPPRSGLVQGSLCRPPGLCRATPRGGAPAAPFVLLASA